MTIIRPATTGRQGILRDFFTGSMQTGCDARGIKKTLDFKKIRSYRWLNAVWGTFQAGKIPAAMIPVISAMIADEMPDSSRTEGESAPAGLLS